MAVTMINQYPEDDDFDDDNDDDDNDHDTCWHICRCPELGHGLACPAPRWDGELLGTW